MNAHAPIPKAPWMTPEGLWSGYKERRRNRFRDIAGGAWGEDYFVYTTRTIGLNNAQAGVLTFTVADDSIFEWEAFTCAADDGSGNGIFTPRPNITIQISDGGTSRGLMNVPIPLAAFGSQGNFPFYLPVTRRFLPASNVQIVVRNFDGALNYSNFQLSFIGRKVYSFSRGDALGDLWRTWRGLDGCRYAEDFYIYSWPFGDTQTVIPGGTSTSTIITEADADFEWIISASNALRNSLTGTPTGSFRGQLLVTDITAGRQLYTQASNATGISGIIGSVFVNPTPRTFLAKSEVQLAVTNVDSVNLNNVNFSMIGRKVFRLD